MSRLAAALSLALFACAPAPEPPNVLVLYTDDQRYNTVGALGNDEIRTPNMDRLVREGTAFTRAHTMGGMHGALCAPSRAMLMTGRPLFDLLDAGDVIPEEHVMMPERFAAAGYATFATGKWHNDRSAFARSFLHGDNIYFGGMHWPRDGGHEAPWLNRFDSTGAYPREDRFQADGYSSALYADAAIAFLDDRRDVGGPFFAYVSFTSPHDPRMPPAPFDAAYTPESVSLPPNYLPEHPFDNGELAVRDEMLREHPRDTLAVLEELAAYYGMIAEVDAQIGRILDALETNGQRESTIVVFAGDNGLAVGSHGLLGKQNLYDHSMRVPLVVAGPGVPDSERRDALVYIHDVFPTISDLAGLTVPATVRGRSLVPVLRDPAHTVRDVVFHAYRDLQRGARTADDWKIIRYHVGGTKRVQLFNLAADPWETRNLAADSAHAESLERMQRILVAESVAFSDPLDLSSDDWGKGGG